MWCGYVNIKISFKAKSNSRDSEGHFIMREAYFTWKAVDYLKEK